MSTQSTAKGGWFDRTFRLSEKHTTVKREFLAGLTTFLTMVYIVAVNPSILGDAGMDKNAQFYATAISSAIACIAIAFYGNFPFALAPSMGLNAYFAYTVCGTMGLSWQNALACVFTSGMLFIVLGFFGVQQRICDDLPDVVKNSVGAGVGFFISLIGFENAGLIVGNPSTLVTLGDLGNPGVLLALFGVMLTAILMIKKVPGSILISIVVVTILGFFVTNPETGLKYTILPEQLIKFENPIKAMEPSLLKLTYKGMFDGNIAEIMQVVFVIISFFFVDLFGSVGVLLGLASAAEMADENGNVPGAGKALTISAAGAAVGALLGTSTVTIYGAESSTGIAVGGRTGLTALFIGLLFIVVLFLSPLFLMIPSCATAPALIIIGTLMIEPLMHMDLGDLTVALPAFLCVAMQPFSYNIAYGILFGLLSYAIVTIASKRTKEIKATTWVLIVLFAVYFVLDVLL